MLLDDYLISGAADGSVKVRPIGTSDLKTHTYRQKGTIRSILKLDDSKIFTICSKNSLILYDLEKQKKSSIYEDFDIAHDSYTHNEEVLCGYSEETDTCQIFDMKNNFKVIGEVEVNDNTNQFHRLCESGNCDALSITNDNILMIGSGT